MHTLGKSILEIKGLEAGYSGQKVLHGIDLGVSKGEIVTVIGHNGAGKTTALKAIFGILRPSAGIVRLRGEIVRPSPWTMLKAGVALVLQGGRVFEDMTILDHIKLKLSSGIGLRTIDGAVEQVTQEFPVLGNRLHQRAGLLSGGERQMLAVGTALLGQPQIMLLDEPSLGLSPKLVREFMEWMRKKAKVAGIAVLLVEQKVRVALEVSNRVCVLRHGRVSHTGSSQELLDDPAKLRDAYL